MDQGVNVGVTKLFTCSGHKSILVFNYVYGFHARDNVFIMLREIQRKL